MQSKLIVCGEVQLRTSTPDVRESTSSGRDETSRHLRRRKEHSKELVSSHLLNSSANHEEESPPVASNCKTITALSQQTRAAYSDIDEESCFRSGDQVWTAITRDTSAPHWAWRTYMPSSFARMTGQQLTSSSHTTHNRPRIPPPPCRTRKEAPSQQHRGPRRCRDQVPQWSSLL